MTTPARMPVRSPAWDSLKKHDSEITAIHLDDVYIDRRFQRVITPGSTQKIVDDFHEQGLGLPLVAVVIGGDPGSSGRPYASLDGQNRFLALRQIAEERRASVDEIRVEAYGMGADGPLSVEEAALLFTLRNNKTIVRRAERQRIELSSGSPDLTRAVDLAEAAGFTLFEDDSGNPATMPYVDIALQVVRWGDKRDRPEFLTEVLDVIGDAWGRDPGSVDPDILRAVYRIMRDNPEIDTRVLSQILGRRQPNNLVAEAKGKRPPKALNIRTYTSIRDFIRMEFNRSASSVGTIL